MSQHSVNDETAWEAAKRLEPPGRAVRILFHINDFGRGGTETALLAWINALDRRYFEPTVAVAYPTDDLAQTGRVRKLGKFEKIAHKVSTHGAIRPLLAHRFLRLARDQDIVCDFDLSLRRIAGRLGVPWIGFSHYSFAARLGRKSAAHVARRVRQFGRYAALAVLTPDMLRENCPTSSISKRSASVQPMWPNCGAHRSSSRWPGWTKDRRIIGRCYVPMRSRASGWRASASSC